MDAKSQDDDDDKDDDHDDASVPSVVSRESTMVSIYFIIEQKIF